MYKILYRKYNYVLNFFLIRSIVELKSGVAGVAHLQGSYSICRRQTPVAANVYVSAQDCFGRIERGDI